MSQVGRISGPLLTANLERNGINLTFRNTSSHTQLLFLDVNSGKIGVNKGTTGYELDINGVSRSTNLLSTTSTIANYTVENNNLNVLVGNIYLNAAEAIKLSNFETDNIHISDNAISTYQSNANIDLRPFGAGLPPNDGVVTSTFGGGEAAVQKDLFGEALLLTAEPSSATWIAIQTLEPGNLGIITISSVDYPFTLTSWSSIDREEAVIDIPTLANGLSSFDITVTIRPITYKTTEIVNDLNVDGNLNATGNITADGNIIIGDSDTDNVTFNADIGNNIIPAANDTYAIGSATKRWDSLYTFLLNGQGISASSLIAQGGGDFSLRQGNIFFVSVNGSDAASGDNVQAPFLTVKRALEAADASTLGPVTIQIFAGEYEEVFPLTVPTNVVVQGVDMRNTIIKPTVGTNTNTAFLLNGETTVQNLTIKDFYTPGYAFEFASNTIVSTRSPYIQNVSVITKGSVTSLSDPRGFDEGDAGGGAYIDGASVNSVSNEASMLFHSCTFITPGVDAVTMTNGVRVEWLNSFTYFANRGLYAVDGVTGHLSTDGSTVNYGAEIRSIGSANVYGNYGAVADGVNTLMYLIQHNFGYIGAGKYVDNDASRAIQANEVVKLNSGKIYYQSVNHFGDFRVGDQFFIDQESGNTSIVLSEAEVDSLNGLVINSDGQTTFINGEKIDIGDFTIAGNLLKTNTQAFNVASNNNINFTSNVAISKNLVMTGDITIGGTLITLGNEATDTVNFNTPFSQNIEPDISGLYNLGSANKKWIKSWLGEANFSDVQFNENYITTAVSNADLDIRANGTGRIYLPNNDFTISNALTTNTLTDLQSVNITGSFIQTGNTTISNNLTVAGTAHITGLLDVGANAQLENILIDGNLITTTVSNSHLDLRASGTGTIKIPNNDVLVSNSFTVNDIIGTSLYVQSAVALNEIITSSQIKIDDNFITTTQSNSDLELRANGTGGIKIQDNMLFNQNIVSATEDLNLTTTGNVNIISSSALLLPKGTSAQRQTRSSGEDIFLNAGLAPDGFGLDLLDGGNATTLTFDDVYNGSGAFLSSSIGVGPIRFNLVDNVFEGQSLAVVGFGGVYSADRRTSVVAHPTNDTIGFKVNNITVGQVNNAGIELHGLQTDDVSIQSNIIRTTVSNSDLELVRNGTGVIAITGSDITFKDNHIINSNASAGLILSNTANGYVKFAGTGAVSFPTGTNADQGTNNQTGDTRYNSQVGYMEVYDGTSWIAAQGGGETVTSDFMNELIGEWSLILG